MILEGKVKRAALLVAVDISLKHMKNSPQRCARNLMELGMSAFPDKITKKDQNLYYHQFLEVFENGDLQEIKTLFISIFL